MISSEKRLRIIYTKDNSFTTDLVSDETIRLYHCDRTSVYFLDGRVTNDSDELSYLFSPTDMYYLEIEKSHILLSSFESKYRNVIHCLYMYNFYYSNNEPKIVDIDTVEKYWFQEIRKNHFGYYFGYEDIWSYVRRKFNFLLDIQEIWEPLGLWEFIKTNRIEMMYESEYYNFLFNYNRYLAINNYDKLESNLPINQLNAYKYQHTEFKTYEINYYNNHVENRD